MAVSGDSSVKGILEVAPYKTLAEVKAFQLLVAEGNLPEWMQIVPEKAEGSQYCTPVDEILQYPRRAIKRNSVPKTMVCNDYKGGYTDDRFIGANLDNGGDFYAFKHWSMIDTFVYFSHYLVTVPPPCYISAAHAHGVSILGTLITEGKSGAEICHEFLKDDGQAFADSLAMISRIHRFDGYLINIENILLPEDVTKMINFLRYLRQVLPEESQLIWYDSVTNQGHLSWQNELNSKNYDFFNVCDGIYLNYNYTMGKLEKSSMRAGRRKHDIYVGVDVFGRGCPGQGFLSSDALEMARRYDLSVAIFAPGWTKEIVPGDALKNSHIFWTSLSKYLYVHGIRNKKESAFTVAGDQRYSSEIMSKILYPLTMSTADYQEERHLLLQFQNDLPNYYEWYRRLPQPIVEIKDSDSFCRIISINKSSKFEYRFIPLMFFETFLSDGLEVIISCEKNKDTPSMLLFYIVVENPRNDRAELFKAQFHVTERTIKTFPNLIGNLLEIGVELPPKASLTIKTVQICTDRCKWSASE